MEDKPKDILGIGQKKQFKPYEIEGGWTVVSPGAELERRDARGKKVVALSKVDINLTNDEDVKTCIAHLEESDRRFAMIPSNEWDWQRAMFKGLVVRFNVEWYNVDFFKEKKMAYLDADHSKMYKHFGATIDGIKVEHFLIDKDGNEIEFA